jgi:hypothetical protein
MIQQKGNRKGLEKTIVRPSKEFKQQPKIYVGILGEGIRSDIVNWEDKLHVVLLGLFDNASNNLGSIRIENRLANLFFFFPMKYK